MGHGLTAAFADRHPVAGGLVAIDRLVDHPARSVGRAPHEREVAALERPAVAAMAGELRRQRLMGAVVLRDHHQAGGVLVEAVHDAGPPLAADAGETVAAMGDQRIDQSAGRVSGGGMHDQPFGLVDHDDVGVLVNHVERNGLGSRLCRRRRRNVDEDRCAGIDAMTGIANRSSVDGDGAGFDQRLKPRA